MSGERRGKYRFDSTVDGRLSALPYCLVAVALFSAILPTQLYPSFSGTIGLVVSVLAPDQLIGLVAANTLFVVLYRRVSLSKPDLWLTAVVGLLIVSTLWSNDPVRGAREIIYVTLFFGVYLLASNTERVSADAWTKLFILFGIVNGLLAISFFIAIGSLRAPGLGSWSNHYSAYAEAVLPFAIASVLGGTLDRQWIPWAAVGLSVVVIIISMSRAGILTLFLIGGLFLLFTLRFYEERRRYVLPLAVIPTVVLLVSTVLSPDLQGFVGEYFERLSTILTGFSPELLRQNLGEARYVMYNVALQTVADNWLTGVGIGGFPGIMAESYRVGIIIHNVLLKMWVSAGVGAFASLLLFVVYIYRSGFTLLRDPGSRSRLFAAALVVSFTGILFHGMFRPVLTSNPFFFIIAGIVSAQIKGRA